MLREVDGVGFYETKQITYDPECFPHPLMLPTLHLLVPTKLFSKGVFPPLPIAPPGGTTDTEREQD